MIDRETSGGIGICPIDSDVTRDARRRRLGNAAQSLDAVGAGFVRRIMNRNLGRSLGTQCTYRPSGESALRRIGSLSSSSGTVIVVGDLQADVEACSKVGRNVKGRGRIDLRARGRIEVTGAGVIPQVRRNRARRGIWRPVGLSLIRIRRIGTI